MNEDLIREIELLKKEIERLRTMGGTGKWQSWTPTFGGFSTVPSNVVARACLMWKTCIATVRMGTSGVSNDTIFTVSAPYKAATVSGMSWTNSLSFYIDQSTVRFGYGSVNMASGDTVFTLNRDTSTAWNNTGNKRAAFLIIYEVE